MKLTKIKIFIGYHTGDAAIEDKHKYTEMDPKASELCRVRYKCASIFIKKGLLMEVQGKEIQKNKL